MRKYLVVVCCLFFIAEKSDAQYVNIPDSNFRNYLLQIFPSCFDTLGRMDTTCSGIVSYNLNFYLSSKNIVNLEGIQYFKKLSSIQAEHIHSILLPKLPATVTQLQFDYDSNIVLNNLPDSLQFFSCNYCNLSSLPSLPNSLKTLYCNSNNLTTITNLPNSLNWLECSSNNLTKLPVIPTSLSFLDCSNNSIDSINVYNTQLRTLNCSINPTHGNILLNNGIRGFSCDSNQIHYLPFLPNSLSQLSCSNNSLDTLIITNASLFFLNCSNNNLKKLLIKTDSIEGLYVGHNQLTELPNIIHPNFQLESLYANDNPNLACMPLLLVNYIDYGINITNTKIKCVPNKPTDHSHSIDKFKLCNATNNSNHCQSFPVVQLFAYTDQNSNNKFDMNEHPRQNIKLILSNNNSSYTNANGNTEMNTDTLGTYTITAIAPNLYSAVPASYTHNFTTYDTLVMDTFALQPTVLKDTVIIKIAPFYGYAIPSLHYPCVVSYENVGTTVLSAPVIHFNYDSSLLIYDSSSVNGVANNGNNLSLNIGNVVPGQTGGFVAYFTVKTTAALGSTVTSVASINTNSVNATDTAITIVRSSYDPNDKQATPALTTQQVADGNYINYTIRFQNTGTDTAFNVVIADTLDSKLMANQMQIVGSSHNCKTTVKDNVIFFEFLNIYLPDSNINKTGSNGFVSFKIKPLNTVTNGTIIPNNAAIYFDYNSPVITNTAKTIIQNTLPLTLLGFNAIAKNDNSIMTYWNTANEINTSFFLIEQSADGRTFKPVVEIAAKGSGSNSYFYSIAKGNIVYLRLKMVDKNGTYTYSNIIKLAEDKSNGFDIVNNPAKSTLNIRVYSSSLTHTTATIVNAQGKIVKTFTLNQNLQTIDIAALQAGNYFLQTILGVKKFVVE